MKRGHFSSLLLSALLIGGCQSEDLIPQTVDPDVDDSSTSTEKIIIQASSGSSSTRIGFEDLTDGTTAGVIALTWENDGDNVDSFSLYDADGKYVGDFKYVGTDGEASGDFEQDGDFSMTDGETYTAVIPAVSYATLAERDAALTTTSQTISDVTKLDHLNGAVRLKKEFSYDEEGTTIAFAHEVSVLELTITMPAGVVPASIAVTDGENTSTITLPSSLSLTEDKLSTFIALEANATESEREISFKALDANGKAYTYSNTTSVQFAAGVLYHASITVVAEPETIVDYYIDGVTINDVFYSYESSGASLLTETSTIPAGSTVVFLDPASNDAVFTLSAGSYSKIVIIGSKPTNVPKVVASGAISLGGGDGVIFKNIDFSGGASGYTFNFSGTAGTLENWIVEDCVITSVENMPLSYFSNASSSIKNISFDSNKIKLDITENAKGANVLSFVAVDPTQIEKVSFTNNVIYTESYYANAALFNITSDTSSSDLALTLKNNTFIDFVSTTATLNLPNATSIDVDKNIFWGNSDIASNTNLIRFTYTGAEATVSFGDNLAFGLGSSNYWRQYNSGTTYPTEGNSSAFTKSNEAIFETFDRTSGSFIPYASFSGYGSTLE